MKRKREMTIKGALRISRQIGATGDDFARIEAELKARFGTTPQPRDVFWGVANAMTGKYFRLQKWGDLSSVYWTMARVLFEEKAPHLRMQQEGEKARVLEYQAAGSDIVQGVRIAATQGCATCKKENGRVYKIEEALQEMPIPNPNCENGWCRCTWMPEIGRIGGSGHGYY